MTGVICNCLGIWMCGQLGEDSSGQLKITYKISILGERGKCQL